MALQEAKYCEDLVPQIKAQLNERGYINEHDRLGHFESKVPLDVFFGLSRGLPAVHLFGIQFKAPVRSGLNHSWLLTHTAGQYEQILLQWPRMIVYGLPWYLDPADSPRALTMTSFANPGTFPTEQATICTRERLPRALVDRALAFLLTGTAKPGRLSDAFRHHDVRDVYRAVLLHPEYDPFFKQGKNELYSSTKDLLAANKNLERFGLSVDLIRTVPFEVKAALLHCCFSSEGPISKLGASSISEWSNPSSIHTSHLSLRLGARIIRVAPETNFQLRTTLALRLEICKCVTQKALDISDNLVTEDVLVPQLSWDAIAKLLDSGSLGIPLDEKDLHSEQFRQAFGVTFLGDPNSVLVWYDYVKRIFYAIESHRLVASREASLSTLTDPLLAGLTPQMRVTIFKVAASLGLSGAEVLRMAVAEFLAEQDAA